MAKGYPKNDGSGKVAKGYGGSAAGGGNYTTKRGTQRAAGGGSYSWKQAQTGSDPKGGDYTWKVSGRGEAATGDPGMGQGSRGTGKQPSGSSRSVPNIKNPYTNGMI